MQTIFKKYLAVIFFVLALYGCAVFPPPVWSTNALQVDFLAAGVIGSDGKPLSYGKVYTYSAGTTSDKTCWTTSTKTATATNPVILNGAGKATLYCDGNYKFTITNSAGASVATLDNFYYVVPINVATSITNIATSATIGNTPQIIIADTTSGSVTATLPTAVGNGGLQLTFFKSVAANTLTMDGNASETINGAATASLTEQYSVLSLTSDNANWLVSGNVATGVVTASSTTTLTNKTLVAPILSGTVTGTYTLTAPVLSGTVTGTYTLGGTPTITTPTITQPSWIDVSSYGSGWSLVSGTTSYMKDSMGFAHLKGVLQVTYSSTDPAWTLPSGYRPVADTVYALAGITIGCGNLPQLVRITTDGAIKCLQTTGCDVYVYLSVITFKAN